LAKLASTASTVNANQLTKERDLLYTKLQGADVFIKEKDEEIK
jgi:hypothetical protein